MGIFLVSFDGRISVLRSLTLDCVQPTSQRIDQVLLTALEAASYEYGKRVCIGFVLVSFPLDLCNCVLLEVQRES